MDPTTTSPSAEEAAARSDTAQVDLYSAYSRFGDQVLSAIRQETFETDIGQNSWQRRSCLESLAQGASRAQGGTR